jgi:4-hydroxybenzoate polyprenyltransferase
MPVFLSKLSNNKLISFILFYNMRGTTKIILNLIKAARFERSLMPASYILIPVALANKITFDISILIICCILGYAIGGLINAKADKDFVTTGINTAILSTLILATIISLYNIIITITLLVSFIMGYIYSKPSRNILFGDSIILSITHVAIPIISAALILNLNVVTILPLTLAIMIFYTTIDQMSNLNGIKGDKENKYKTLMTLCKNGKLYTHLLMNISFLVAFAIYFLFDFSNKFLLIILLLFSIETIMNYFMNSKREIEAYGLMRLITIIFPFAFICEWAHDIRIFLIGLIFIETYLTYYIANFRNIQHNGI